VVTRPIWSFEEATSRPVSPYWSLTTASWPATAVDFARSRRPTPVPGAACLVDRRVSKGAARGIDEAAPTSGAAGPVNPQASCSDIQPFAGSASTDVSLESAAARRR
jgi:hypothetical protein